ncbi:MAG: hypothetical protein JXA30_18110 [Deltaproteobacteria bacterium]|nr:hypothetical protein [Deltaproteobacteria bacterium]
MGFHLGCTKLGPKKSSARPYFIAFFAFPLDVFCNVKVHGDIEALIGDVETAIGERQSQAAAELASQGRTVKGVKAIMRTDVFDSPSSPRAAGKLNPQIAAGGDWEAL